MAKDGRLKRCRERTKQYRQNKKLQNNERIFYQQVRVGRVKSYQQPDANEAKRFWSKVCEWKDHNKKSEWINIIEKELWILEEGLKVKIYPNSPKTTLKNIKQETYTDFGLKNTSPSTTDWRSKWIDPNWKLRRRMNNQRKFLPDTERLPKWNRPRRL